VTAIRQQINLYQPRLDESIQGPFSSATAALVACAVVGCLLAFWLYAWWRVDRLERAVSELRRQQQQQAQTMASLGAARAVGVSPAEMDTRVKLLAAQVAIHSGALDMLRSGAVGQVGGFSSRLTALARRAIDGVWIDHVILSGLNDSMSVGGTAVSPELIPRYLAGLGAEQALRGVRFDAFAIERQAAPAGEEQGASARLDGHVNFRVESGAAPVVRDKRS
jgi:hypothetical protein